MIARAKGRVRAQASYGNITVLSLLKMATMKKMRCLSQSSSNWMRGPAVRGKFKRECPLRPSHIENIWHMMKNQNFSYSSQRYPKESLETWCDFLLEIFFLTRQKNQKSVTVPSLVKNTQISVTNTLSKTSLCLIRIKIIRQFGPGNLFLRSLQVS